jgi:hypothetical protein
MMQLRRAPLAKGIVEGDGSAVVDERQHVEATEFSRFDHRCSLLRSPVRRDLHPR